jgi:hypothetical protein
MAVIQREFYRSARGPTPADEDWWVLIFDDRIGRLFVRHQWQATGHAGIDEFEIAEFLAQKKALPNRPDRQPISGSCRRLSDFQAKSAAPGSAGSSSRLEPF